MSISPLFSYQVLSVYVFNKRIMFIIRFHVGVFQPFTNGPRSSNLSPSSLLLFSLQPLPTITNISKKEPTTFTIF